MKIYPLENPSSRELKPLIANCKFITLKEYEIPEDLIVRYITNELSELIYRKGSIFVAEEQEKIMGLISLEKLNWDSKHFGIDIFKISHLYASGNYSESFNVKQKLISHLQTRCLTNLSLHISTRVYKEDLSSIHALENRSFQLMDVLMTYLFDFRKQNKVKIETQTHVRPFKKAEIPQLAEIARICFKDNPVATDRFHADPTLSKEKSDELYVKWLVSSCRDSSDQVFVAEVDGKPVGFNICKVHKPFNDISDIRLGIIALTAVKPSERNKHVATSMINTSLDWFADKADIVETGGQASNYPIQKTWAKTGFNVKRAQCSFTWSILPESV
jgi:hypothetical protein